LNKNQKVKGEEIKQKFLYRFHYSISMGLGLKNLFLQIMEKRKKKDENRKNTR
jgi:hypothetical protein